MAGIYFELDDQVEGQRNIITSERIRSLVEHIIDPQAAALFSYRRRLTDETTGKPIAVEVALQYNDSFKERRRLCQRYQHPRRANPRQRFDALWVLREYAEKINSSRRRKLNTEDRRKAGSVVKMPSNDLQFESQTKTKLNNSEAQSAVYSIFKDGFTTYLEEHPQAGRAIIDKIMLSARARMAARAAKDAVVRKGVFEGSSLPGKLADCQSRNPAESEIYIVEGDSAGGSAKQGRDRKFQAIFPLRGKILNTERARLDRIVAFEELKNLVIALGAGIGDTFDPSKLRYHRIILMNDADVDGEHITTLGLTFFFRHLPEIVEQGYLM